MIITTTNSIEGKSITKYLGVVTGIKYAATFNTKGLSLKDVFSSKRSYEQFEKALEEIKEGAFQKLQQNAELMKANAIVGVMVDIESVSTSMYTMVSVVGTAVVVS